jgi:hypothetical protein
MYPTEFDVRQAMIEKGSKGVFVIRSRAAVNMTASHVQTIREVWARAWRDADRAAPSLLIIDSNMELSAMADAELQEAGLMRIPLGT